MLHEYNQKQQMYKQKTVGQMTFKTAPEAVPEEPQQEDDEFKVPAGLLKNQALKFCGIYATGAQMKNPHNHPEAKKFRGELFSKLRQVGQMNKY